jgi:hypothetical protein
MPASGPVNSPALYVTCEGLGGEIGRVLHELLAGDVADRARADHRARAAGVIADQRTVAEILDDLHALGG